MTGRRIPETYRNQDWPRKVARQVNEIQSRIDSGEFDGGGGGGGDEPRVVTTLTRASDVTGVNATAGPNISWDQVDTDPLGFYDPAEPTRLTIPAGVEKVRLSARINITGIGTADITAQIRKNGTINYVGSGIDGSQSGYSNIFPSVVTGIVDVVEGDYFEHKVFLADSNVDFEQAGSYFLIEVIQGTGDGSGGGGDGGGGGTQDVNDLISGDGGNSLIVGGDGKLYVPPIIPDSASVQLSWIYLGVSGESNPNPNSFRMNNANPADVTQIYVSEVAYPNRNIANIIEIMRVGDVVYLQQRNDETRYILATLLSLPTENTGFFTLDVEVQDSDQAFQINQFNDFVIYHGGGEPPGPGPGPDGDLKDPVFTYDGDFLTRIDYDDGSFKTFAYVGGNLDELVFEPNGGTTITKNFFYDAQGRLSNIVET